MKGAAAVLHGVGQFRMQEFPLPVVGPDDGLLKMDLAGVCASDIKYFTGSIPLNYPVILGHEITGTIAAIGERMAARHHVQVGDRVIVEATIACGHCSHCVAGRQNFCHNRIGYGKTVQATVAPHFWGGYGQYLYLSPQATLQKIPDEMPPEIGVLIGAVIANGIEWVTRQGELRCGEVVVIQGVGQQGMAAAAAAKAGGASLIIATGLGADARRFDLIREFGADVCIDVEQEDPVARVKELTGGEMADLVVDVTGNPKAIAVSIRLVRKAGRVISAGTTGANTITPLYMDQIVFNGIRLQGVFSKTSPAVTTAIKLAHSGRFPFHKMITHRLPLHRAEDAIRTLNREFPDQDPIKVVLDPWAGD